MRSPLRVLNILSGALLAVSIAAGCAPIDFETGGTTTTEPDDSSVSTGVPGGKVTPDNPDVPGQGDPSGGTIPATLFIDGEETEANACEVVAGLVRVRAGDEVSDTGVVVEGGATNPSMTLLNDSGGVEATSVEFEAVADDADSYTGTFGPEQTGGIETITAVFNVGVPLCPEDPAPEDSPGSGMIPALMVIDGEETEANACEVDDGSVQVRAESGTTVVVDGGATDPSMTLSDESGGVEALSVEFEAVADDADRYIGTFDPELTGDIGSITVEYNVGLLLCSDD